MCFQAAKVSRPLISASKMTEMGELHVLCKKDEALVVNSDGTTVARFKRRGRFYVAMMKIRNQRFRKFLRPAGR